MKRDDALDAAQAAFDRGDLDAASAALADYNNWKEGGNSRALMQAAGGGLVGGLGGGALGAVGGAVGAGLSSKLADQTKAIRDAVSGSTDSALLGNIAANIVSGLGGALVGGSAGAAGAANVNLYNQGHDTGEAAAEKKASSLTRQVADVYNYLQQLRQSVSDTVSSATGQFVRQMNADAKAKASESATDLMAQGAATGAAAVVGMGGGKPPAQSPGAVLVNGAGQALAGGTSSGTSVAGYEAGNATFTTGNSDGQSSANSGNTSDLAIAANQPLKDGQAITNAGRAVTKHPEYFGFESTQELRQVYRSDAQLNELAANTVQDILQNGTKTTGAGGRYPNGWVTYTLPDGRAASWTTSGEFIGFRGVQK